MGTPKKTASAKKKSAAKAARKTTSVSVSDATLSRLPEKVVSFLVGIGNVPDVRARLTKRGYNATVHQTGWLLLDQVGGRASLMPPPVAPLVDEAAEAHNTDVDAARQKIETWAVTNLAIASAALEHTFPAQHEFVFADGLKAGQGNAAVLSTHTFLTRIERLGAKRRGAHPDDAKALALLGERGIDDAERARVRSLLTLLQQGKAPAAPSPGPSTSTRDAQVALYAWYNEWTRIAKVVIKRRDHLVRLGLASLRRRAAPTE